jgi:oligopeptide transport system permease protein
MSPIDEKEQLTNPKAGLHESRESSVHNARADCKHAALRDDRLYSRHRHGRGGVASESWGVGRIVGNRWAAVSLVYVCVLILSTLIGPMLLLRVSGQNYYAIPSDPALVRSFAPFKAPDGSFSLKHPAGTDNLGRDLLARILIGGRISLLVSLCAAATSFVIGLLYGTLAGYMGGRVDAILMRSLDALFSIPYLLLVIVALSLFRMKSAASELALLIVLLGSMSWFSLARIVRTTVIEVKLQEFVTAAQSVGASSYAIIRRHIIPNSVGPAVVYLALMIPSIMLSEAFLSFVGLGIKPPMASWGSLVAEGLQNMAVYPWQIVFPCVAMASTVLALTFVGDGIRDAFDPYVTTSTSFIAGREVSPPIKVSP